MMLMKEEFHLYLFLVLVGQYFVSLIFIDFFYAFLADNFILYLTQKTFL